jgi:replicative DNA helicase
MCLFLSGGFMLYKRVAVNSYNNYQFVPYNEQYIEKVNDVISSKGDENVYETIYSYNQEQVDKAVSNGSASGLTGMTTNRLIFDLDCKSNVESAQKDTKELVSRLLMSGIDENAMRVYFSGNKGFHVEVQFKDEQLTKREVDNIVKNISNGLETVDGKILDENRLIRVPLTKNSESEMYKIPLTREELNSFSLLQIRSKAKVIDQDNYDQYSFYVGSIKPMVIPAAITALRNVTVKEKKELDENIVLQDRPDSSTFLQFLTPAKNALLQGFFGDGERNSACMILASTLRHLQFDKETAYNILKDTLRKRSRRLGHDDYDKKELWTTIIEPVFAPSWKGGTYSEKQNDLLKKTIEKYELQSAVDNTLFKSPDDMVNSAISFLKNFDKNRVKTGIKILDEHVFLTKGMLVGLLGSPGSGKTSFLNTFVEHTSMSGNNCLYLSMDMSEDLLAIRMLGKYTNKSMKELQELIVSDSSESNLTEARKKFKENFGNAKFSFKTGPTLDDIDMLIKHCKAICGDNLTMIALDYMEKIKGPFTDNTANSAYIASKLNDMAKDHNVCIVLLLQPQKMAGDVREPLLNYRKIKGSSSLEQDCRVILTIWRPGYDPEFANDPQNNLDKYSSIAIVKQNMGSTGKFNFLFDAITGNLKEMNQAESVIFDNDMRVISERIAERNQTNNESGLF